MQAVFRDETGGNTCSQSRAREGMASGMLLTECTSFAPQLLQAFLHADICAMLRAADTGDLDAILMATTKSVMLLAS